jgi:cell division protein FtsB
MIEEREEVVRETPGWIAAAIGILAIVALVAIGFSIYDYSTLTANIASQQSAGAQFKTAQQDQAQKVAALDTRLTQSDATNAALQSDLGVVTKRLRLTEGELKQARDEAAAIRTDSEQKIADLNTNVSTVSTQLATKASSDDLNAVNGTVTGVKTDLESTKNDLKMARSELGTLIARNHEEIDTLRRMGERDYVEFTINGRNKPQKIGAITVELRSVDTKKNKFTVALVVDDLRTEKKDRTVDEPIVFYPNGTHQADEFVVNSVSKDKITGYVSMPKNPGLNATVASSGN